MRKSFPIYRQPDMKDCGPTCLRMIAKHYGKSISLQKLREISETNRIGSSLKKIADTAEVVGFRTLGVKVSFNKLMQDAPLPCIVHWNQEHFVVVYKIDKKKVYVADPSFGAITYTHKEFIAHWMGNNATTDTEEGVALLMRETPSLKYFEEGDLPDKRGFSFLFQYVYAYRKFLIQLIIGLVVGSILQLCIPFLTQSVVDIGIQNQDINFVYLILIAQLCVFIGKISVELIRSWILLHLSTRINISLISDFFIKLMRLPIGFFDTRMTGDILQRINDHKRIENLLTNSSLTVLFSVFNLVIFGVILAWYNQLIFFIFLGGSALYFGWIFLFMKRRETLDYKRFSQLSQEQSKVIELINGMQEIKLHNAEKEKRWSWEYLQARLFKISIKSLVLEQTQTVGSNFINEIKNVLISILSVKLVIEGEITLGMMMSISYITGQLNGPIQQLISVVFAVQDAKIALQRLSEIHNKEDEENSMDAKVQNVPDDVDFKLNKICFRYDGGDREVLNNLSVVIPRNKKTAIVGASGSGKTTLLKMLLKFYEPQEGAIMVGDHNLSRISQTYWREKCGVVMQEGYIFNDSIANNITMGIGYPDPERLAKAVDIANIKEFIERLPLAYNTKIGNEGVGISTGQKQRILIARAVYKNPDFIFFDEATSSLDAKNEREIMEKLDQFFSERTAVVIAHRLSTVKNADQIIVLDQGKIQEVGTHSELVSAQGTYYNLVSNQLQLENLHEA